MKSFSWSCCLIAGMLAAFSCGATYDLERHEAVRMFGAGPPELAEVIDSWCISDTTCEDSGDDCDNSWGTECTAHGLETQVWIGKGCGVNDGTVCRLNRQLWVCKKILKCVFDEDENCVVGEQVQDFSRPAICFTGPGGL